MNKEKINVLVWGATAVDSAIISSIAKSPILNNLFLSKTNITSYKNGIPLKEDGASLIYKAKELNIDLAIVNSIANDEGIIDAFERVGIKTFGVNSKFSKLESSKSYGKNFMEKYNIPHPKYIVLKSLEEIDTAIKEIGFPMVLKPDGYTRGTGVEIVENKQEAISVLKDFFNGKYLNNSKIVVAEELIKGKELSLLLLWNKQYLTQLPYVQDYKRLYDDNKGWNTGGMGAYCPVHINKEVEDNIKEYIKNLEKALKNERANFCGPIYCGLMITEANKIKTLEFNMRLGDSEGQTILNYMESDFLELIWSLVQNNKDKIKIKYKQGISASVNVCSLSYPRESHEAYAYKSDIEKIPDDLSVYFYNITEEDNIYKIKNNRFFSVCCCSEHPFEKIYNFLNCIKLKNCHYRKDLGK